MLVKKLAVPLINEKLLSQAVHCLIVTSGISLSGFEFIRSRVPTTCKIDVVTGLDEPTDPAVLKRILKHYAGRVTLKIFTRNRLNANMIIIELPFRKTIAFVGSGSMTMDGLKDGEEVFWKVTDPKDIESLNSWFVGYYEFAEPLTDQLIDEYELIYHRIRQREIQSGKDKEEALKLSSRGFSWDAIKFKLQFFKKEDFILLGNRSADRLNPVIATERQILNDKLIRLENSLDRDLALLKLHKIPNAEIAQFDPNLRSDGRVASLGLAFGRGESFVKRYPPGTSVGDFVQLQFLIKPREVTFRLGASMRTGKYDRENLLIKLSDPQFRSEFMKNLSALGGDYKVETAGANVLANALQTEDALAEFLSQDNWQFYELWIGKDFQPGDAAISEARISETIVFELQKIKPLYDMLKHEL